MTRIQAWASSVVNAFQENQRIQVLGWMYVAAWTGCALLYCVGKSLVFSGILMDGTMQVLNPLRRLEAGQVPGVDFVFFHGTGIPFLLYPFYKLFGGGVNAAEMSRYLISLIAFLAPSAVFGRVITGSWRRTGVFLALLFVFLALLTSPRQHPGNSLMAIRSLVPFLFCALLLAGKDISWWVTGGFLGVALWMSTEQGLALLFAYVLVQSMYLLMDKRISGVFPLFLGVLSACASYFILLVLSGGWEGAWRLLKFYYQILPADQFWYFGAPPNVMFTANVLYDAKLLFRVLPVLLIASYLFIHSLKMSSGASSKNPFRAVTVMLVYGMVACTASLAMFSDVYFENLVLGCIFAVLLLFFREKVPVRLTRSWIVAAVMIGMLLLFVRDLVRGAKSVGLAADVIQEYRLRHDSLSSAHRDYMERFERAIDSQKGTGGIRLWSTYAGILEEHYGTFHPHTDYIIHAIGHERRSSYLQAFKVEKPRFVQTALFGYEEWIQNTSAEFYRELLENYDPLESSMFQRLWVRGERKDVDGSWQRLSISEKGFLVPVVRDTDPEQISVYWIRVRYTANPPLSHLPIIGKAPRFLIVPDHAYQTLPVSLDPSIHERLFFLVPSDLRPIQLSGEIVSIIPGSTLRLEGAEVNVTKLPRRRVKAVLDNDIH